MKKNLCYIILTIGLGLGLTLVMFLLMPQTRIVSANPAILYVATDGDDSYLCESVSARCRTVRRAINLAGSFDEIRVAVGTYTETEGTVARINRSILLLGGWNSDFSIRDPNTYTTTLDAQRIERVIYIAGSITVTIDGFVITGGNANNASPYAGRGGGIYSYYASPIIQNNIIIDNIASISPTNGAGGGIYLTHATSSTLISDNKVISNTAFSDSWGLGGGGIFLTHSYATIQENLIQDNSCSKAGGGIYVSCCGAPRILDNDILSNESDNNGGGIYSRYAGKPYVEGNLISGNTAVWYGGGVITVNGSQPTVNANEIYSNTAFKGGGVIIETSSLYTVTNNFVAHNNNGGIRIWDTTQYGLVAHNTVAYNTGSDGGIILDEGYITPTILNNIVVSNSYGIRAHTFATGTLDYNDVWGNTIQDYDLPGALEPGVHDIQENPLFVAPTIDDYHLQSGSPCIEKGVDAGIDNDIDGDHRPLPANGKVDIGADEFILVSISAVSITGPTIGNIQQEYLFTATVSPISATLPITYEWQASGQEPVSHSGGLIDSVAFTWVTPGTKTITVTADNGINTESDVHIIILEELIEDWYIYLPRIENHFP